MLHLNVKRWRQQQEQRPATATKSPRTHIDSQNSVAEATEDDKVEDALEAIPTTTTSNEQADSPDRSFPPPAPKSDDVDVSSSSSCTFEAQEVVVDSNHEADIQDIQDADVIMVSCDSQFIYQDYYFEDAKFSYTTR